MRDAYDRQLEELGQYLKEMGSLIERAIGDAINALISQDKAAAKEIIRYDEKVDHQQRKIENLCMQLLLSQQPVATDLRMVSASLKMVTDMERIGDHAADISEIILLLCEAGYPRDLITISNMAKETISMVTDSISAFIDKDAARATAVILQDDVVDEYFVGMKKEIIRQINTSADGGEQEIDLLMIAKYLERIGDHATNIAEWALFYITGEHPEVKN